jgi:GH25 family lysozyme M1 (1,4-beta-N-acetylmuramidase)
MQYGLDLSEHNDKAIYDNHFWEALKESQYTDFIILRMGYGVSATMDETFLYAYNKAKKIGIPVISAYWFIYSMNEDEAKIEAQHAIDIINNLGLEVQHIWADIEDNKKWQKYDFDYSAGNITDIAKAWVDTFKKNNLKTGIYANYGYFKDYIEWEFLNVPIWVAHYTEDTPLKGYLWQQGDDMYIDGYGPFDYNVKF